MRPQRGRDAAQNHDECDSRRPDRPPRQRGTRRRMLSRARISGMSGMSRRAGRAYVTGAASMFGPSVRNHLSTLSVTQKRTLAPTPMADI
jgi:hypothetical protein